MSGRFTNIPSRLRAMAKTVSEGAPIGEGQQMALSSLLEDSALKIDALERGLLTVPKRMPRGSYEELLKLRANKKRN